jgi:hypothetical protein
MERGVIVGGGLITASFLVAILLNRSAREEAPPIKAVEPPARVCEETPSPQQDEVVGETANVVSPRTSYPCRPSSPK